MWPVKTRSIHKLEVPYTSAESQRPYDGIHEGSNVNLARAFHASRSTDVKPRYHAAVDLIAFPGDEIVAVDDGIVQGPAGGYVGLGALVVEHAGITIVYAEMDVDASLKPGDKVHAGQKLGVTATSQSSATAPKSSMLHFETWEPGTQITQFQAWYVGAPAPTGLLDPTVFLLRTAGREPT